MAQGETGRVAHRLHTDYEMLSRMVGNIENAAAAFTENGGSVDGKVMDFLSQMQNDTLPEFLRAVTDYERHHQRMDKDVGSAIAAGNVLSSAERASTLLNLQLGFAYEALQPGARMLFTEGDKAIFESLVRHRDIYSNF